MKTCDGGLLMTAEPTLESIEAALAAAGNPEPEDWYTAETLSKSDYVHHADIPILLFAPSWLSWLVQRVKAAEAERDRLARWKSEAWPVMEGMQDLGKALGLPMGERITGPAAVEAAVGLKAERDAEHARANDWRRKCMVQGRLRFTYANTLRDFANFGTRCDTTPTILSMSDGPSRTGGWYGYIQEMDTYVRTTARAALDTPASPQQGLGATDSTGRAGSADSGADVTSGALCTSTIAPLPGKSVRCSLRDGHTDFHNARGFQWADA